MPDAEPTWVRVRLENGSESSVRPAVAKRKNLTVLDKPAEKNGRPLPAKHNPLKPKSRTKSKTAQDESTTEEKSTAKAATTTPKES